MRLTEDKIRRLAENLHDGLEQQGLLEYKDARGAKPGAGISTSHDWRLRGTDHGEVRNDQRAERLGPAVMSKSTQGLR